MMGGGGEGRGLTICIKIFKLILKYFSFGFEKLWQNIGHELM